MLTFLPRSVYEIYGAWYPIYVEIFSRPFGVVMWAHGSFVLDLIPVSQCVQDATEVNVLWVTTTRHNEKAYQHSSCYCYQLQVLYRRRTIAVMRKLPHSHPNHHYS